MYKDNLFLKLANQIMHLMKEGKMSEEEAKVALKVSKKLIYGDNDDKEGK